MRTSMKCVVVLVGLLGMAASEADENTPNPPTQGVPVRAQATVAPLGAAAGTRQSEHATKMRTLGVCAPSPNHAYSGDNVIEPIGKAHGYFQRYEHRDVTGMETTTILQQPKHGVLRLLTEADGNAFGEGRFVASSQLYVYLPEQDYVGKDSATIQVDIGGTKVKVKYYFHAISGVLGDDGRSEYCSKTGYSWQISSAPPEEIPPPIVVTDDLASLAGRQISERVISPMFPGRYSKYTSANPLIVSPDGLHVAYVAGFGAKTEAENDGLGDDGWKQHYLILDGKKSKYDGVMDFHFSPDSKHTAYRVETINDGLGGMRSFFVVDGREGEHYVINDGPIRYLSDPKFSSDSSHFAYQISASAAVGPDYVVVDGKKGKAYANISRYCFSPDGQRLAYIANNGASRQLDVRGFVVVDGQEGKHYDSVSAPNRRDNAAPVFSPDSKRVAYFAESGTGSKREIFTVVNGHEGKHYPGLENYLEFSPNSQHLLYLAQIANRKWSVVIDEKEGKYYDGTITNPIFSPDSKRTAYVVKTQDENGEVFVVVDGQEGKHYSGKSVWVSNVAFSPDNKRVTYNVRADDAFFIVADGKEYHEGFGLITSPDGLRLAYVAYSKKDKKYRVVVNGQEEKQYDKVDNLVFSPDGKTLAYAAYTETYTEKGKKWRVVVNGQEGKAYDMVLAKGAVDSSSMLDTGSLRFDGSDRFHYLAINGKNIILVEEKLGVSETK